MRDIFKHFTVKGVEYPFAFNINVVEDLDAEYRTEKNGVKTDGITEWGRLVEPQEGLPSLSALKFMFTLAINEGIEMENEERNEDRKPLTLKQVGRIISAMDDAGVLFAKEAITESTDDGTEKNVQTRQNQDG